MTPSSRASGRSSLIHITSTWIRLLPQPIARRETLRKRLRSIPKLRRRLTSRVAVWPLPTRGLGRQNEARKILDQLVQERRTRYVSAQIIAAIYVGLGDKEEAFRWLELAATEHSGILQWIAFLPEFRPLRPDKRFPNLLRRIGVPTTRAYLLPRRVYQRSKTRTPKFTSLLGLE